MRLSDTQIRRLAEIAVGVCVAFYLVEVFGPPVASLATGHGWYWDSTATDMLLTVMTMMFPFIGVLVVRRQPRNAVGWVMLAVGIVASIPLATYFVFGYAVHGDLLPGARIAAALESATWAPILGLMGTFLILLFPDGHLPSSRWRPVGWLAGFSIVYIYLAVTFSPGKVIQSGRSFDNPLALSVLGSHGYVLLAPSLVLFPLSIILCAAGLVVRFRRSVGTERLQLKWLTSAGALVALFYAVAMAGNAVGGGAWDNTDPTWLLVIENIALFSFALIPLAIGVAILKHGLYDIDLVINRAVVFALLAGFITVVYVAIVVGVGRMAGRGDRPDIVLSIVATTVVAVAFQPVRERVRRFANRLVYGRRATPYEVLSDFAGRVGGAYDAADLLPVMARTVAEGLAADRVEIWLATGPRLVREAVWPDTGATGGAAVREAAGVEAITGDWVVAVRHHGELLGALAVTKPAGESLRPAELTLLDDVAAQAGLVLRNVRLVEDLRSSRERLMSSQDDERRQLERRLHDGAQRRLRTVASLMLDAHALLGPDKGDVVTALDQLTSQLEAATEELGELARGIHPAMLTELGLGPAVRALAERSPLPVAVEVRGSGRLSRNVEATLYFVASEALTNIVKYAHATSVTIMLRIGADQASLEVSDDGIGGVDETRGSGVRGLRDRVMAVDGTLEVLSPPGGGTHLTCVVPQSSSTRAEPALSGRSG